MISRTHIKSRMVNKTNTLVKDTITAALKTKSKTWHTVAQKLSAATRKHGSINLNKIDKITTTGDTLVILGKVLGGGDVTKKLRLCALSFSGSALDKLKKTRSETVTVLEEITKNPKANGVKVL